MERWVCKKITRISLSVLMLRWQQIRFCCKNINICIDFFPWFMSDKTCFIYLGVHDHPEEIDPFAVLPNLNNSLFNTCLPPGYLILNFLILSKSLLILLLTIAFLFYHDNFISLHKYCSLSLPSRSPTQTTIPYNRNLNESKPYPLPRMSIFVDSFLLISIFKYLDARWISYRDSTIKEDNTINVDHRFWKRMCKISNWSIDFIADYWS